ncbi:MAG: sulfate adenylyltransferase subunit 2, partial [Candidatus Rokubacteria bacterium]|nr:sulfate adenylyltransferase subunit 2 [Candidatus Rokubacteria bacterium]
ILREAYAHFKHLGMLWSIGKDSTVLLWLARRAFFGHVPFPLIHIDTAYKIPEMIAYRDRLARELGFELIIGRNTQALADGMNHMRGRLVCCTALKTDALRQVLEEHKFSAIIVGIRRDEEGSRAKERVFSARSRQSTWDLVDQPPEFWDQYRTDFPPDEHVRVHPLLRWTEVDVWRYIEREQIPIIDLYLAREGRRYRSLGCEPCTASCASTAQSVSEIIAELVATRTSERSGRAQDQEHSHAMEKLRVKGYM